MIENIGIDIVENERIKNSINNRFIDMVLSKKEKETYNKKIDRKKLEYICGRFCAKEAIIKCLSNQKKIYMNEIEIMNDKEGRPIVKYKNYNIKLSISHEKTYTTAISLLIKS